MLQLTQKLTLIKHYILQHDKGGLPPPGIHKRINRRIAKILASKHHGKHSSFGENFAKSIPNLAEHNFVDRMSQFINEQSTEVQLPPPGPAPEPQAPEPKAPKPKLKKTKTKPSYSYELLNKNTREYPARFIKTNRRDSTHLRTGKKFIRTVNYESRS